MKKTETKKQPRGSPRKFNSDLVIAGHGDMYRDRNSKTILKKLQPPPKGSCEEKFYKAISSSEDPTIKILKSFCPKFYGINYNEQNEAYLKLEDLTRPFKNPCIIDIKIGRVTWDPNASEAKRIKEESKYPPLKKIGFQMLGCRVSDAKNHSITKLDKSWGRSLNEENILAGLKLFLSGAGSGQRLEIIKNEILSRLYEIRNWFLSQTTFRFYASSILILYDGVHNDHIGSQGSSDSDEDRRNERMPLVDVRMIDFAHVFDGKEDSLDENYLYGMNNLIHTIEALEFSER